MLFPHGFAGAGSGDGDDKICAPIILVVEDNPVMARVAHVLLEELGYGVEIVENGAEALDAIARSRYSAVLMDCQMDGMDGYEATRRIRERDEGLGIHTTIIALTTQGLISDRQKCLDTGMDDYLHKPVSKEHLKRTLDKWVGDGVSRRIT
jgi:two-component system sensor histidine kinase/response regulator